MPRSKPSAKPLRASSAARQLRLSRFARSIVEGLQQGAAHARGEISLPVRHFPGPVNVRAVRTKTRLSQSQFANRYGFNPRTLQEWEQGRSQPESAVRAYLLVIARNPRAVEEALAAR